MINNLKAVSECSRTLEKFTYVLANLSKRLIMVISSVCRKPERTLHQNHSDDVFLLQF